MKLKELESYLSECEPFTNPKIKLEQYPTSSHIASRMLYSAQDHIKGASVCDLGSGCGILSIGSVLLEAAYVLSLEIDPDAINIAKENAETILDEDSAHTIDFVQTDVIKSQSGLLHRFTDCFDVVIMNPPFGTKNNEGIDWSFVQLGLNLIRPGGHIYSLHKTSTRSFFIKKFKTAQYLNLIQPYCNAENESRAFSNPNSNPNVPQLSDKQEVGVHSANNQTLIKVNAKVLAEVQFNLPKVYKFHKEKNVDISVDFWDFEKLAIS